MAIIFQCQSIWHMPVGNSLGGGLYSHIKEDYRGNYCVCGHTTASPVCILMSMATHVSIDMEWTNEKALEFLELFQAEPILWDTRQKNHKNRGAQNDAWCRIKQNLPFSSTIDDLKKKKESLMNYYRNHLNKYKKSIKSGAGRNEIYSTNWYAFEIMDSFLRPVYESNSELNSEVPSSGTKMDSEAQETNRDVDCPTASTIHDQNSLRQAIEGTSNLQPANQSTNKQRFVKKNVPSQELIAAKKQMDEAFHCMKSITQRAKYDDEYDHFGLMIAAKIRKINDPFDRESLMNDIHNLVFQSIMRNRTPSSCGSSHSLPSNVRQSGLYSVPTTQANISYCDLEDRQNSQSLLLNYEENSPYSEPPQTNMVSYDLESGQSRQVVFIPTQTSSPSLLSNIGQSSLPAQTTVTSDSARQIIISNTGGVQILDNQ